MYVSPLKITRYLALALTFLVAENLFAFKFKQDSSGSVVATTGKMQLSSPDIPARGKAEYKITSNGQFEVSGKARSFLFGSHSITEKYDLHPDQVRSAYYTFVGQLVDFDGLKMTVQQLNKTAAVLHGDAPDGTLTFYFDLQSSLIDLTRVDFKASLMPVRLILKKRLDKP